MTSQNQLVGKEMNQEETKEESNTLDLEGPFKVSNIDLDDDEVAGEIDLDELKVNGFTVDEMLKCFKRWLLFNQENSLKDFNNPNYRVEQDGNEFTIRFTDTYTFKMVLEEVKRESNND